MAWKSCCTCPWVSTLGRRSLRTFCPNDVGQFANWPLEHAGIEKHQCIQRLILGARCNAFIKCEVLQERADLSFAHFQGVPFLMEQNKLPGPVDVGLLGSRRIMFCSNDSANLVQETWRWTYIGEGDEFRHGQTLRRQVP
jgi:hypothetical protein